MRVQVPSRRHAVLIARTEVRRRYRSVRDQPRRSVALVIAGLFGAIPALLAVGGAYVLGTQVRAGGVPNALPLARSVTGGVFGLVFVMTTFRVAGNHATVDHADGLLTAVPHRDVTAGLILAEAAGVALPIGGVVAAAALSFAVGARSPLTAVLAVVAVVLPTALALLSGFALGVAVRLVASRVRVIARYKTWIGALLFLAYLAVLFLGQAQSVFSPIVAALQASPAGWFADLALAGILPAAGALRAVGALVATAVLAPSLLALAVVLPETSGSETRFARTTAGTATPPSERVAPPTRQPGRRRPGRGRRRRRSSDSRTSGGRRRRSHTRTGSAPAARRSNSPTYSTRCSSSSRR
ncbi:MAG: hypothetical protein ABEJ28_03840 [Salinigranum sp.]